MQQCRRVWSRNPLVTSTTRRAFERPRGRLDIRGLDDPAALERLDTLDKRIAKRSLARKLDPDGPLFIDYAEHVACTSSTDLAPMVPVR